MGPDGHQLSHHLRLRGRRGRVHRRPRAVRHAVRQQQNLYSRRYPNFRGTNRPTERKKAMSQPEKVNVMIDSAEIATVAPALLYLAEQYPLSITLRGTEQAEQRMAEIVKLLSGSRYRSE